MKSHETEKTSLSDLEIDSFEKSLENDLNIYDLNLKDEIEIAFSKS
jgi:hypothetical protein